jgi:hypothetical protein
MRKTMMVAAVAAMVGALVATPIAVYASHQFTDVPDSNIFHDDISWLADAGVTKGCNPPANDQFCPKDTVTRETTAAFLHRLAVNQVVDAGELRGYAASELAPRAAFSSTEDAGNGNASLQTEITAPAPGVLLMSGTVHATNPAASDQIECVFIIDGMFPPTNEVPGTYMYESFATNEEVECTTTGAGTVDAGTYTVTYDIHSENVVDVTSLGAASTWVMWVPFDGSGITPTGG